MFATYERLNLHVYDSDVAVIRAGRRLIAKKHRTSRDKRDARHTFYRRLLACHHSARRLYHDVMTGNIS